MGLDQAKRTNSMRLLGCSLDSLTLEGVDNYTIIFQLSFICIIFEFRIQLGLCLKFRIGVFFP
jgi:hypothetical protein